MNPEKRRRLIEENMRIRAILASRWPQVFSPKGAEKRPLKVGILKDICVELPELSFQQVRNAITDYCFGPTYNRNVVEGAPRLDLQGKVAGHVTAEEAEYAAYRMRLFKPKREAAE